MPTTVIKSIGTAAGRDYASISSWLADRIRSHDVTSTGSDTIEIGEVYNDGPILETIALAIAPDTGDSAHPITLRAATNQGWCNKSGDASLPLTGYDEARGACVRNSYTGLQLAVGAYATVDGLQFTSTAASGNLLNPPVVGGTIQNCILDTGTTSSATSAAMTMNVTFGTFRNNVFVIRNAVNRPAITSSGAPAGVMEFNTFWNQSGSTGSGSLGTFMISPTTAKPNLKFQNNLMIGWAPGVSFSNNGFTAAQVVNNASNSTFTGWSSTNYPSITTTAEVTSLSDVRPISGGVVAQGGVPSVAASPTLLDVFGRTRSTSTPTIGAVEYIAAVAPPPPAPALPRRWAHIPFGALQ